MGFDFVLSRRDVDRDRVRAAGAVEDECSLMDEYAVDLDGLGYGVVVRFREPRERVGDGLARDRYRGFSPRPGCRGVESRQRERRSEEHTSKLQSRGNL